MNKIKSRLGVLAGLFIIITTTYNNVSTESPVPLDMCEGRYKAQRLQATGNFITAAGGTVLLYAAGITVTGGTGAFIYACSSTATVGALMKMIAECGIAENNKEKCINQAERERKNHKK